MRVVETELPGVVIVEPDVYSDSRGFFLETFHAGRYADLGIALGDGGRPAQLNHSHSIHATLRGLHFQEPRAQGKLVWVVSGAVFDVAVDVRRGSPTCGKYASVELSADRPRQLWIPPGFAHGFCVLSDAADCMYACSDVYAPDCEHSILWNDPDLAIDWPIAEPLLSPKDARAPRLSESPILPVYQG